MAFPEGLSHVAMSVPDGTLTDSYRGAVLEFYGRLFGWREIESLRLPDRLTLALNGHGYLNVRERPDPMLCSGYDHFGIVVESAEDAERVWSVLAAESQDVNLEPLDKRDDGFRSFRFRYLLPLTVEVQFFPS